MPGNIAMIESKNKLKLQITLHSIYIESKVQQLGHAFS
jgi:hypothetical protein